MFPGSGCYYYHCLSPILRIVLSISLFIGGLAAHFCVWASASLTAPDFNAKTRLARSTVLLRSGHFGEAAALAASAAEFYQETEKPAQHIKALLQLAEAQQALGEYPDAARTLNKGLRLAEERGDARRVALILGALGNLHIALGPPSQAEQQLLRAAALAEENDAEALQAIILNDLGNHYAFQGARAKALAAYTESAKLARKVDHPGLAARTLANAARVTFQEGKPEEAKKLAELAAEIVPNLEDSHDKAYLLINLARTLRRLDAQLPGSKPPLRLESYRLLNKAQEVATQVADPRAASYALGYLGELYEAERRYEEALVLTGQAIFHAQQVGANESLYLWHWQRGRLLNALGERETAIDSYRHAVDILQTLRHQMRLTYGLPGASFRESVSPIYFELVDLLLEEAADTRDPARIEVILRNTRTTVERFKAAELRDYFQDDCVDALQAKIKRIEEISPSTVVIYPILLKDRVELLLSFPTRSMKRYAVPVDSVVLTEEVRKFRRFLEKRTTNEYRSPARRLYKWLIEPFESNLAGMDIDTLVFVPGGALRTVPMSALYDGKRFLIEKYAVATTPGLELTDPTPLNRKELNPLFGGLSKSVRGFPALAYVSEELKGAQHLYGGKLLLDEQFRRPRLKETLDKSELNVLHLATHGQFSGDVHNSFLLTYDGRLTIDQLAEYVGLFKFRDTPLELLVLSACETAQGDDRAALGLSGIAIKAGARSALGALWKVNDVATSLLINDFYKQLQKPTVSRAIALQRAQQSLLEDLSYRHPGYWSAFLLINSWL